MARLWTRMASPKAIAAAMAMLLVMPTLAAPDGAQQAVLSQLRDGQSKLHQIEHIPVAERGPALHEHMTLIGRALASAQALQPAPGMSLKERVAWQGEQQKLLEAMVKQMLDSHHLTMEGLEK